MKRRVLFVCVENAGRSQMAEAFARHLGNDVIEAASAGTRPAARLNPTVIDVMKERGIDLSDRMPRILAPKVLEEADLVKQWDAVFKRFVLLRW